MEVYLTSLPSLKHLKFLRHEENTFVNFDEWINFLRTHCSDKTLIRRSNILKELRNHNNGLIEFEGKLWITITSLIRYIANHAEHLEICSKIIQDIIQCFLKPARVSEPSSILSLYKQIANLNSVVWSEYLLQTIQINDSRTLYANYKPCFSDTEWKRICLFEYHFVRTYPEYYTYEEELNRKEILLKELEESHRLAESIRKMCEKTLAVNQARKFASEELNGHNFEFSDIVHSFPKVDATISDIIKSYNLYDFSCVSVACHERICNSNEGIHVYLESDNLTNCEEIATIVRCDLEKLHKLFVHVIVFVKANVFKQYCCKNCSPGNIHRHELHDDFFLKKIANNVTHVSNINKDVDFGVPENYENEYGKKYCAVCFEHVSEYICNPLSASSLNIVNEWILQVPLEIQELMTSIYINKESLRKSDQLLNFLKGKLVRLYCLFDAGLNSYNRNYTGILQQLNSEELIVNYHSLATVFEITSQSGCTQSLKTAERWLRNAADSDKSYYETYIKRYPLVYKVEGDAIEKRHEVGLRDCVVILFMDNLVRLTVHEDPDPSHTKTSQICTLPITLKGLPRNSADVKGWHDTTCEAQNDDDCKCFESRELKKEDINLLLENTKKEKQMWEQFSAQSAWGIASLLQLKGDCNTFIELLNILSESKLITSETDMHDLDVSMHSLALVDQIDILPTVDTENDIVVVGDIEEELTELEDIENMMEISLKLDATLEEEQFVQGIINQDYDQSCLPDKADESQSLDGQSNTLKEDCLFDQETSGNNVLEEQSRADEDKCISYEMHVYKVPPLIYRHPIPATGRDDDVSNLKQILQDILVKLGRHKEEKIRILFAPDHKISKNLLKLMKDFPVFRQFLPEFPALHLRKSKIVNLFSAYKSAGLLHLLKFMKDSEQEDDWMKLITLQNIETATRNITRLAMALHLAFLTKYLGSMETSLQVRLVHELQNKSVMFLYTEWDSQFQDFLKQGDKNATFALHLDMMHHCDEIVAISIAEKIGGPDGYHLLLTAVKQSLPFSFLNGASSYAAFCVDLLYEHYGAGTFHQNMKMSLFSTPYKDGNVNIALDTQREMDHKDAIKGFRPRSTIQSVIPRMTIVDRLNDTHRARKLSMRPISEQSLNDDSSQLYCSTTEGEPKEALHVGLSKKDLGHILPVTKLILRVDALNTEADEKPRNVYESNRHCISEAILDRNTYDLGQYLIKKYTAKQALFGLDKSDCPDINEVEGPKELKRKAKTAKSVTMRRTSQPRKIMVPNLSSAELKRQANVKKKTKEFACMSSTMNTCQSLVNPDCSKATVQKSLGIRKALFKALWYTFENLKLEGISDQLSVENLIVFGPIPTAVTNTVKYATIEFAGVKFKTKATSGVQYLKHIENGIFRHLLLDYPNLKEIVVCEEKYSFTPDDFKAGTRAKRQKSDSHSIAHLKVGDEIISEHKLSKSAVLQTGEGKRLISNYLAKYISKLDIKKEITVDVDSELIQKECSCSEGCCCPSYCLPIRAEFSSHGFVKQDVIEHVHQRKGEAEMAQVDWLDDISKKIKPGESVLSVVTSADIDSLVIHLFAVSLYWPRNSDSSFKNTVYVLLQKQNQELYNITGILERLERHYKNERIGVQIALVCCMGGNDFLPKFQGITHEKWMTKFIETPLALTNVIKFDHHSETGKPFKGSIDKNVFLDIVKQLFCPKNIHSNLMTIEEVRQLSIKPPKKDVRHPTTWMPPISALEKVTELVNCQLDYLFTTWNHSAVLPVFMERGCLVKDEHGNVKYNFGLECRTENISSLISEDESELYRKTRSSKKNQKREKSFAETPEKETKFKKRPMMSTPIKMRLKKREEENIE